MSARFPDKINDYQPNFCVQVSNNIKEQISQAIFEHNFEKATDFFERNRSKLTPQEITDFENQLSILRVNKVLNQSNLIEANECTASLQINDHSKAKRFFKMPSIDLLVLPKGVPFSKNGDDTALKIKQLITKRCFQEAFDLVGTSSLSKVDKESLSLQIKEQTAESDLIHDQIINAILNKNPEQASYIFSINSDMFNDEDKDYFIRQIEFLEIDLLIDQYDCLEANNRIVACSLNEEQKKSLMSKLADKIIKVNQPKINELEHLLLIISQFKLTALTVKFPFEELVQLIEQSDKSEAEKDSIYAQLANIYIENGYFENAKNIANFHIKSHGKASILANIAFKQMIAFNYEDANETILSMPECPLKHKKLAQVDKFLE